MDAAIVRKDLWIAGLDASLSRQTRRVTRRQIEFFHLHDTCLGSHGTLREHVTR